MDLILDGKKEDKEKTSVVNFKDKSSNWWVNSKHYCLNEQNEIVFVAGGIEITAETEFLRDFIKRNKKTYVPRQIISVIEYFEIVDFGIHKGRKVDEIDKKYLKWMIGNYNFSQTQEKLKQEIINILK